VSHVGRCTVQFKYAVTTSNITVYASQNQEHFSIVNTNLTKAY